jgi:hypothetical protein
MQEKLQNVLKSFVLIVEPDLGLQLQHLNKYLQKPTFVDLVFTQQMSTLTGGIDKRWVLSSAVGHPFYNTTDTNGFVNYDLRQFLQQNKKLPDKESVKYMVYLVMTTIPPPIGHKSGHAVPKPYFGIVCDERQCVGIDHPEAVQHVYYQRIQWLERFPAPCRYDSWRAQRGYCNY